MSDITNITTPEFRVSFPQVFEPKQVKGKGAFKYQLTMLWPKDTDLGKLKIAVINCIKDKWGDNPKKKVKTPFLKGNEQNKIYDGYEDTIFIRTNSLDAPGVLAVHSDGSKQEIIVPKEFYAGCYAVATVRPYAWEDDMGGYGVSFGLQNILKTREGEPFSAKPSAESEFEDYVVEAHDQDDSEEDLEELVG